MFILGFFWKKTTSNAALFATVGGFLLSVFFKVLPQFADLSFLQGMGFAVPNAEGIFEIPFLDRMGFVFLICVIAMYIISTVENRRGVVPKGLEIDKSMFRAHPGFIVGSLIIVMMLVALYSVYW
ncbi:Sodium/glucose cotransporter [compost metagenome]